VGNGGGASGSAAPSPSGKHSACGHTMATIGQIIISMRIGDSICTTMSRIGAFVSSTPTGEKKSNNMKQRDKKERQKKYLHDSQSVHEK
jgi:hypothetical protein